MSNIRNVRGGSWDFYAPHLKSKYKMKTRLDFTCGNLGFRVVQDRGPIVIKCGAWDNFQGCLNTARRGNAFAKDREHFLGFRVVER